MLAGDDAGASGLGLPPDDAKGIGVADLECKGLVDGRRAATRRKIGTVAVGAGAVVGQRLKTPSPKGVQPTLRSMEKSPLTRRLVSSGVLQGRDGEAERRADDVKEEAADEGVGTTRNDLEEEIGKGSMDIKAHREMGEGAEPTEEDVGDIDDEAVGGG
jgi:hypothetical protein